MKWQKLLHYFYAHTVMFIFFLSNYYGYIIYLFVTHFNDIELDDGMQQKERMCKDNIIYLPCFLTNWDDSGIVICEILFLVSTIVFLASEMFQMRRLGWYYLKEHENYIQLFVIFSAFLSMFAKPILLGE